MGKGTLITLGILFAILVIVLFPYLTYLSINELVNAEEFDFGTWLAGLWFLFIVGAASTAK